MRYVFDIETDNLLESVTKIHSIVLMDVDTEQTISCADQEGYTSIKEGLDLLAGADCIIGHNIVGYDLPVLGKLLPSWRTTALVRDTLLMTRLMWPDVKELDFALLREGIELKKLTGSHSLEAWGVRMGHYKGDFGKTTDWSKWSKEMQDYCEQDVKVTLSLWRKIEAREFSEEAIQLEHDFAEIISHQIRHGFPFDLKKAHTLAKNLVQERLELENQLRVTFKPWYKPGKIFTPKGDNRKYGYQEGCPMTKIEYTEFNPGSRDHIGDRLIKLFGWKPQVFTKDGKPKLDDEVISTLPWPEAKLIGRYLMVTKRLGQLAEGDQAWLKLVKPDGRIHGGVITNGTVTGRCAHVNPNVAQVPSVTAPYGKECRELFTVLPGYKLVGADASGLELRMLGHYLSWYDGGKYGEQVVNGDIHTVNQHAAGLPDRPTAKRFIYAWLYGAGPVLIGSIVHPEIKDEEELRKLGVKVNNKFLKGLPALKRLKETVKMIAKDRGFLKGLDGRELKIRSVHSALNMLFQSAGSILVKKATVLFWQEALRSGLKPGTDFIPVAHVHDELQVMVREGLGDTIGAMIVQAFKDAGTRFELRVPMDGEYKIGNNWAETH